MVLNKKKKLFVLVLSIVGICILGLIIACYICLSPYYQVKEFSLEDYSEFIQTPSTYNEPYLGKIDTQFEARKAALMVFREVYADYSIAITPPYIVSYDSENDVWLIQAGMYFIPEGGAHIIINASDGEILGLWNYKF